MAGMTGPENIIARAFGLPHVQAGDIVFSVPDMVMVIDGASDLLFELFGPTAGFYTHSTIDITTLPRGIAVEINGEFEVRTD